MTVGDLFAVFLVVMAIATASVALWLTIFWDRIPLNKVTAEHEEPRLRPADPPRSCSMRPGSASAVHLPLMAPRGSVLCAQCYVLVE